MTSTKKTKRKKKKNKLAYVKTCLHMYKLLNIMLHEFADYETWQNRES